MFENRKKLALPETVDEVADLLISDLMAADIVKLVHMKTEDFLMLYREVANILLDEFNIWTGNDALLQSCVEQIGIDEGELDPAFIILRRVREKLQEVVTGVYIVT